MRSSGTAGRAAGLGPHDHLCWAYEHGDDLHEAIVEFLADGLARGLRVAYAASWDVPRLRDDLAGLDDLDGQLARGALRLLPLAELYGDQLLAFPEQQVARYATLTREALADGFSGLRVAVEATELVRTGEQREVFARYEHLVDAVMVEQPFSALCAYDRHVLGPQAVAQLACLHPLSHGEDAPFRVFAGPEGLVLTGEVDLVGAELFAEALERVVGPLQGRELPIDVARLDFIDLRGLAALDARARAQGGVLVLRHGRPVLQRAAELLSLSAIRVDVAAA